LFSAGISGSEVKKPKEETGEVLRQSVAAGKVSVPEEEIKKEEPAPADLQPDEDHIAEIPLVEKYYKKPAEKQAVPSAGSVPGKTFEKLLLLRFHAYTLKIRLIRSSFSKSR